MRRSRARPVTGRGGRDETSTRNREDLPTERQFRLVDQVLSQWRAVSRVNRHNRQTQGDARVESALGGSDHRQISRSPYRANSRLRSLPRLSAGLPHQCQVFDGRCRGSLASAPPALFRVSLRSQLTSTFLNTYVDERQEAGAANATINRELAALKRMFNLGRRATPPKVVFVPAFPRLAENNIRQGFLEDAQYEKLLESCLEFGSRQLLNWAQRMGGALVNCKKLRVNQIDLRTGPFGSIPAPRRTRRAERSR